MTYPAPDFRIGDDVLLYCGDCLEILPQLPDGCVDIGMTSPPYNTLPLTNAPSGIHAERRTGVNKWMERASRSYFDNRPEIEYQQWVASVVAQCLRTAKGLVWVNHKVRYRDKTAVHPVRFLPFPIYAEVVWDRGGSMALNCKRYAPSYEMLYGFGIAHFWDDGMNRKMAVWRMGFDRDDNDHPCAYPVELAHRPIFSSCPQGGIVLDPFGTHGAVTTACRWLAMESEHLIGSGRSGFFLIRTQAEKNEAVNMLVSRAKQLYDRVDKLNAKWRKRTSSSLW